MTELLTAAALAVLAAGPGWQASAAAAEPAVPRLKAVQVLVEKSRTEPELRRTLAAYRRAGFDTVIMRAFHLPGDRPHAMAGPVAEGVTGVYFPTQRAPVIMDIMEPFVRISREEGLRPFAWMVTRKARFGDPSLPHDVMYDPAGRRFRPLPGLDTLNPATWPHLEGLFADLAGTGVDGILLQDDMASRMKEGFSEDNVVRYLEETGSYSPPWEHLQAVAGEDGRSRLEAGDGFLGWVRWKTAVTLDLVNRLQAACSDRRPGAVLIMNQMYESVTDPENGRLWLSQDLELALARGPAYSAVMLYHDQMRRELDLGLTDTFRLMGRSLEKLRSRRARPSRVMFKLQTHSWETGAPLPAAELAGALNVLRGRGWSLALVPPPTAQQIRALRPVLEGL